MQTGAYTREGARELVKEGNVLVDKKRVTSEHFFIKEKSLVEVQGKKLMIQKEKIYLMLNKPKEYVCQKTAKEKNVLELVKEKNIFVIGRLDKDTEGLLLLTNDGDYAHQVLSPEHHVEKEYLVILEKEITQEEIKKLETGVAIDLETEIYTTKPCDVLKINAREIKIRLREGKKRQIRRMLEAVDNKVLELKRIRIGNLLLGNLKLGTYRVLSKEEALQALQ